MADHRLTLPGAAGVADYVHRMLDDNQCVTTPDRRVITLGATAAGTPATLPASGINVMISGDPRSGKSWLAGMIAEQLIDCGYRLCVFDPEGDYGSLAQRPRVLTFGDDLALPAPTSLAHLLRHEAMSLVLVLTRIPQAAQQRYVAAALCELQCASTLTGLPHWIVLDEAQYFFRTGALYPAFAGTSNFLFSSYRPSLVADAVYDTVKAHIVTRTAVEEERYFLTSLLKQRGPIDLAVNEAFLGIDRDHVGLLLESPQPARWQSFTPGTRLTAHSHHGRKYADQHLPEQKAFRFVGSAGALPVAHSVLEFHRAVRVIPTASLHHHLRSGDFSRWANEVLGNQQLARGLQKLERDVAAGATPIRDEVLANLESHYTINGTSNGAPTEAEPWTVLGDGALQ
jgi:hypothetical protein